MDCVLASLCSLSQLFGKCLELTRRIAIELVYPCKITLAPLIFLCSGNILWKALSPMMFIYPEQRVEYEGAVSAWVHLLITRTDKLSAIHEAFCRRNLPNVTNLLATCLFVPIAISFQGLSSIVLPVRTRRGVPSFQFSYLIKTSNMLYGPIVLHRFLVSSLYNTSQVILPATSTTCCHAILIAIPWRLESLPV